MQPHDTDRKTIGSALVDVFDAALALVKTELKLLSRRVGKIIKAKGMGAVLLLAATGPLIVGLIFLILALFYALNIYLQAWASALIIGALALVLTAILAWMGAKKLTAEVKDDEVSAEQVAREDVAKAEKKLDKAEDNKEKAERDLDKAERQLDRVEDDEGVPVSTRSEFDQEDRR